MTFRTLLLTVGVPALALAGCEGTQNRGIESVHQPVVQRQDYAFDVAADFGGLAPGEAARVGGWFAAMRLSYGDKISVDDPNGFGDRAYRDVSQQAAQFGIQLDSTAPATATPVPPGSVRVVVSRATASVPGCPDFTRYKGTDWDNNATSNFGCASNSNLAAMIADPMDLVRGASDDGNDDAQLGTRAIGKYRRSPSGTGSLAAAVNAGTGTRTGGTAAPAEATRGN